MKVYYWQCDGYTFHTTDKASADLAVEFGLYETERHEIELPDDSTDDQIKFAIDEIAKKEELA